MLWFRVFRESLSFAWQAILVNRLRTFLSLLGVMVGIFVISAVFAVVDSLEEELKDTFSMIDDDVLFITKWPWEFGEDYPWWKYVQRRVPTERDLELLMPRLTLAQAGAFQSKTMLDAEAGNNGMPGVVVVAASQDYPDVISLDIAKGRFFTAPESNAGRAVAVVGHQVAMQLFGRTDCLGQTLKVRGTKLEVVGVFVEQGQSLVSSGFDESMMVPSTFAPRIFDVGGDEGTQISIKARPGVDMEALKSELIQHFRCVRRVRPGRENDFAVNHMDFVATLLEGVFDNLEKGGWFIAMFAILVGCFSIANIMFVSVRERTKIIGVQKAIGAKNTFILIQFLFEAVTLCVFGALLALVCIQLLIWGINATDFGLTLHIAPKRVMLALGVAVTSGLVAGMAPARQAANLPPVEAMRTH